MCTLPGAESTFCTPRHEGAHLGQGAAISRDTALFISKGRGTVWQVNAVRDQLPAASFVLTPYAASITAL